MRTFCKQTPSHGAQSVPRAAFLGVVIIVITWVATTVAPTLECGGLCCLVQASQSRSRRERLLQTDTHRELVTCPGCDNFRLCVWVCDTVCVFVLGSHVTCWFVPALQNSDSLQRCVWLAPPQAG